MVHPLSMVASLWAAAAAAMVDVDGRYNTNNILVGCVCMCSDVFGDRTNTSEHIQTHSNTSKHIQTHSNTFEHIQTHSEICF